MECLNQYMLSIPQMVCNLVNPGVNKAKAIFAFCREWLGFVYCRTQWVPDLRRIVLVPVGRSQQTVISSVSLWEAVDLSLYFFLPGFSRDSPAMISPQGLRLDYTSPAQF